MISDRMFVNVICTDCLSKNWWSETKTEWCCKEYTSFQECCSSKCTKANMLKLKLMILLIHKVGYSSNKTMQHLAYMTQLQNCKLSRKCLHSATILQYDCCMRTWGGVASNIYYIATASCSYQYVVCITQHL